MRIIRGTRDAQGNVITKVGEGGVGRVRCMKCQGVAVPHRLPNGKQVLKCTSCQAVYGSVPMDKPRTGGPLRPPRVTRPRTRTQP